MELCCVPLLAGLFVGVAYYYAHQRGYKRGYQRAVEVTMLLDLGARLERADQEEFNIMWHGTGEEGASAWRDYMVPKDDE